MKLDLNQMPVEQEPDDPITLPLSGGRHRLRPTLRALHEAADDPRVVGLIAKVGGSLFHCAGGDGGDRTRARLGPGRRPLQVDGGPHLAEQARTAKLVDALGHREHAAMRARVGEDVEPLFADRWRPRRGPRLPRRHRGHVALVEVRGAISSGRLRRGPMGRKEGSDSFVRPCAPPPQTTTFAPLCCIWTPHAGPRWRR